MSLLKLDTMPRPIADNAMSEMTAALSATIAELKAQIELCETIASDLYAIKHYKVVNKSVVTHMEKMAPDLYTNVVKRYGRLEFFASYKHGAPNWKNVRIEVAIKETESVGCLIEALRDTKMYRSYLDRAERQLARLGDLIDAENGLREMVRNFEAVRNEVGMNVLGPNNYYIYHDAVKKFLPTLAGN